MMMAQIGCFHFFFLKFVTFDVRTVFLLLHPMKFTDLNGMIYLIFGKFEFSCFLPAVMVAQTTHKTIHLASANQVLDA